MFWPRCQLIQLALAGSCFANKSPGSKTTSIDIYRRCNQFGIKKKITDGPTNSLAEFWILSMFDQKVMIQRVGHHYQQDSSPSTRALCTTISSPLAFSCLIVDGRCRWMFWESPDFWIFLGGHMVDDGRPRGRETWCLPWEHGKLFKISWVKQVHTVSPGHYMKIWPKKLRFIQNISRQHHRHSGFCQENLYNL